MLKLKAFVKKDYWLFSHFCVRYTKNAQQNPLLRIQQKNQIVGANCRFALRLTGPANILSRITFSNHSHFKLAWKQTCPDIRLAAFAYFFKQRKKISTESLVREFDYHRRFY